MKTENLKIEVNNKRHLLFEFLKTNDKKYYNQQLKITTLDLNNKEEKIVFINENELVLLYNYYIYQKENKKEIF